MTQIPPFMPLADSDRPNIKQEHLEARTRETVQSSNPTFPTTTQIVVPEGSYAAKYSLAALYRCKDAIDSYYRGVGAGLPLEIIIKKVLEDFTVNEIPYSDVQDIINKLLILF